MRADSEETEAQLKNLLKITERGRVPASGRTRQTLSPRLLCPGSHTSACALYAD